MIKATLCLVIFAIFVTASDTSSNCYPIDSPQLFASACSGTPTVLEENSWTEVTVNANSSTCFSFNTTTSDTSDVFVFALRPGGDAAGDYYQVAGTVYNSTGGGFGCAAIQKGQEKNDMDFHCYPYSKISNGGAYITLANANKTGAATLEVYAGYSDGSVSTCAADYVDEGIGTLFWVGLSIIIVLLLCVVVAGVLGGAYYYRKKKRAATLDYDTYEEA